jgi:uncharacterized protein YecT (DUF1311 family)
MRMRSFSVPAAVLALAIFGTTAARADDCSKAQTTIDMNECANGNFKAADRDLNRIYDRALVISKESDRDIQGVDYSYEKALRATQRAWIAFRDADCVQPPPPLSGSIATMERLDCMTQRTIARTKELTEQYGNR